MTEHNRQELVPPEQLTGPEADAPPELPSQKRADDPEIAEQIDDLIHSVGGEPGSFDAKLIKDLLVTGLKLIPDQRDTGELKLITAAMKELRYAYRVFGQYPQPHKVSIFGSARTPEDHPDYHAAREYGKIMAQRGWMVITGAGDGIMKAGHEGPGRESSFGVAIRLPFETTANDVIAGDDKLIHFRYFFTRKLMFLSQSEAVALFPGGFGTMDEAYESLTLIQTGKSSMIPIVMCEGEHGTYWEQWDDAVRKTLLDNKFISPEDLNLYKLCAGPQEAADEVLRFYRLYHSSRYVRDDLVIRLQQPISQTDVQRLTDEFKDLIDLDKEPMAGQTPGTMTLSGPLEWEDDHLDLPRLVFTHTRHKYGRVRALIDAINNCEPA